MFIKLSENEKICPTIYLDNIYERYSEENREFDYYVQMIIQMRNGAVPDDVIENVDRLMNWETIKDSVYPVLLSTAGNEEYLSQYVSKPFLDLSIIYEVRLSEGSSGTANCKISNSLLNNYGITRDELHEQALANMKNDGYKMEDLLEKLNGRFAGEGDLSEEEIALEKGKMYILTNRNMTHGAACLLYEDFLKENLGDTTAFILPSSIHESIFVPVEDGMSAEEFDAMVCTVNESAVEPSIRLSNHCYLWDGKKQKVTMATV